MLKALRKEVGKIFNEKDTQMSEQEVQTKVSVETLTAELATSKAAFEEKVVELANVSEALATMNSQLETLTAELATVQEHRDAVLAKAKQEKDAARMSAIKAAIGDDKAPGLFAATEQLSDEAFQAVVGAMASNVVEEGKSAFFKEVGVSADADVSKVTAELSESPEMKIIKAKYHVKQ
jgi:hypothetical protein